MSEEESIFRKIKTRLLPPSSRSFHSCMGELRDANRIMREQNETLIAMLERAEGRNAELIRRLDGQSAELAGLRDRIDRIDGGMGDISRKCDIKARHDEVRFEAAARMLAGNEGLDETPLETRKRIFEYLSPAEGDRRLMQRANAKLMGRLDEICRENGLDYWFAYGTLVGTLARSGSIPWDDDIDICMMRDDIRKLSEACAKAGDVQLTLVYDLGPLCRQVRFSSTDDGIPCFIDVSIYDWAKDASEETDGRLREIRLDLMDELRSMSESGEIPYWNEHPWLFARGSGFVPQVEDVDITEQDDDKTEEAQKKIQSVFDRYNAIAADEGLICEKDQATAIAYAADNIYDAPWRRITWKIGDFLPPQRHAYDGYEFCVPNRAEEVATECYPGWPYFPNDILGHEHFASSMMNGKIRKSLREYVDSDR